MKLVSTTFALLLLAAPLSAQMEAPDLAERTAAMKKIAVMTGDWTGSGWIQFGPRKSEFSSRESIQTKAGGMALVTEGLHTMKLSDGTERVIHDAFGMITPDPAAGDYRFVTQLATGRGGDYRMKIVGDGQFEWSITGNPQGTMRYTITIKDGAWNEVGEISSDGKEWKKFFEMNLKQSK